LQRFERLLLTPVTILGMPAEAGLNQKNSTSLTLGTQTAFDFHPPKTAGGFYAPLQQASLSQNAQWRSQKPFKPCAELCDLFAGHNARSYLKNADHVQGQGAGRRKSGAYMGVCEHFKEVRNTVIGR
jgi:hypothetical protein